MITETAINRISGLTLNALQGCEPGSYASRMLRHAMGCAMRAKAALRKGNDEAARQFLMWGRGSVRLAIAAGPAGKIA